MDPAPTPLNADTAALLDPARWSRVTGPGDPSAAPPLGGQPVASPRVARPGTWITDTGWGDGDRATLRQVLNGRYDVFARVVTRTLAEEPGLRATGSPAELVPELVALCAYHAGERNQVNKVLRTGSGLGADDRATILARGALRGLRRLPAVHGPVFAAGHDAEAVVSAYRAGDELVEPAFVDVDISGGRSPEAPVEYVIWSVSAHRLGRFGSGAPGGAVFVPGSRFAVLAIDPPDGGREPLRVLLRDRAGARPGRAASDARLLDRLRGAVPEGRGDRPVCHLGFAPGLDEHGRRYAPPPADVGHRHGVSQPEGYASGARGVGFAG
jgi:hypothetical protein